MDGRAASTQISALVLEIKVLTKKLERKTDEISTYLPVRFEYLSFGEIESSQGGCGGDHDPGREIHPQKRLIHD